MRPQSYRAYTVERAVIVPTSEIELYLLLGWRLIDEPMCAIARMLPPKAFAPQYVDKGVYRETGSRAA